MRFHKILITGIIITILTSSVFGQDVIKLATTTSTYETGLLDYIFPPFEKENNVKIHIISVGTGKAIALARNGDVDIVLVHARKLEDEFVDQGYGVNRRDVMYNDFVIVGPKNDPAGIMGIKDPVSAFKKIYSTKTVFVSRGDNSGTHVRERAFWKKTGLDPEKSKNLTYLESGQGQSATLRIADEKQGYAIIDRGTFLFQKNNISLGVVVEGGKDLLNPYGVIAVSPYRFPDTNYKGAMNLIRWLTSPQCQKMIDDFRVNGNILFHSNAEKKIR